MIKRADALKALDKIHHVSLRRSTYRIPERDIEEEIKRVRAIS